MPAAFFFVRLKRTFGLAWRHVNCLCFLGFGLVSLHFGRSYVALLMRADVRFFVRLVFLAWDLGKDS